MRYLPSWPPCRAYMARGGYNCAHAEEKVDAAAVPLAGELVDRAASYTVPMKAVPAQFGPLGRVRPAPSVAPEWRMDRPGRQFLCARCRQQAVLCTRCDRGNRYCGRACRRQARDDARRKTASRYQRSYRGRLAHAARSRRWRQRHADATHNVTHQGSQLAAADAPLLAWTLDTAIVITHAPSDDVAPVPDTEAAELARPCRRCAAPLGPWVRQGFLRHGLRTVMPMRRRHDPCP